MDFTNAALLIASVYGIVELAKVLVGPPHNKNPRIIVGLVIAASFGAVFLVAHTAWANEQVIGDKTLDSLGVASLVLVALMVAGAQTLVHVGLKTVRNIGSNELSDVQREALDVMAARQVEMTHPDNPFRVKPTAPPTG